MDSTMCIYLYMAGSECQRRAERWITDAELFVCQGTQLKDATTYVHWSYKHKLNRQHTHSYKTNILIDKHKIKTKNNYVHEKCHQSSAFLATQSIHNGWESQDGPEPNRRRSTQLPATWKHGWSKHGSSRIR